ncbi:dUTPase-like protein [Mycena olivaceomarginata]|nr:dUTPase-like protein [Mycena olivaceomarginata]
MSPPPSPLRRKEKMSPSPLAPVANLLIKRLSEKAKLPTRGSALSAGYDFAEKKTIPAHGKALVDTQISIAVPAADVWTRRATEWPRYVVSTPSKFMIDTGAGVIDADYRGVVFVLLFNSLRQRLRRRAIVNEGDRVAQLIIERIYTPDVLEVQARTKFESAMATSMKTLRGAGGFGSTGGHGSL